MGKLDQVYNSVTSIDNDLASAQEELMRAQAQIESLTTTREAKATKGSALESRISLVFSTIDRLREEFVR